MSTNKVTGSIYGMQFGMGGPYKIVTDPPAELREKALAFMRLKAQSRRLLSTARYKIHERKPHEAESLALDAMGDAVMLARAAASSAMYATGHRWSVLALEGRYLYLCRGVDEHGDHYDPSLHTGELSEQAHCEGCDGTGKRTYRVDLGPQKCFTCQGRGSYPLPLPETVRRAVDAEACARKRAAEAEARKLAESYVVETEDDPTVEVEVIAHVD